MNKVNISVFVEYRSERRREMNQQPIQPDFVALIDALEALEANRENYRAYKKHPLLGRSVLSKNLSLLWRPLHASR